MKIRTKLLVSYSILFVLFICLAGLGTYTIFRNSVHDGIESELNNATVAIMNMVRTSVSVSIKNHLRAVAEKNLEMVTLFYERYRSGEMSEEKARKEAERLLLSQRIGTTGYIACVNSQGTMVIHPAKAYVGADISSHAFVKEMTSKKEGYIEYDWQNPGDPAPLPKALYMTYFAPWDWIINASSYRLEFRSLVNVEDLEESVLNLRFGKTGYAFVINGKGEAIIHPRLKGRNIFEEKTLADEPLRTMLRDKNGKIEYLWQNPGEPAPRKKLVIYNYIPEYDWIVASSSYMDEFYAPLENMGTLILFVAGASMFLALSFSTWIAASITTPLQDLVDRMAKGAEGDLSVRMERSADDETGHLGKYFNIFMERLEKSNQALQAEIAERRQVEEALRVSESRYRSIMDAAPDPIVVYDMQGRVVVLNQAFTDVFGWNLEDCRGKKMDQFVPEETWPETRRGLDTIASGKSPTSIETRRYTKDGRLIDVSIRGAVYRDANGAPAGSVVIHRDVSDVRRLEREVMDIGDRERQIIGQDLHDDLCPHLIGIEGLCKVLKTKVDPGQIDASRMILRIIDLIKEAISKTRYLARGLCPVYLVDHGLSFSLQELASRTQAIFQVACDFRCDGPVILSDNIKATHLFQIAQEAVSNAIRHGKAKAVTICLERDRDLLRLCVEDDGVGIPPDIETSGMGLRIMGFRAKMIDALLDIHSTVGSGTRIQVTLNDTLPPRDDPDDD